MSLVEQTGEDDEGHDTLDEDGEWPEQRACVGVQLGTGDGGGCDGAESDDAYPTGWGGVHVGSPGGICSLVCGGCCPMLKLLSTHRSNGIIKKVVNTYNSIPIYKYLDQNHHTPNIKLVLP
jgi:hypothetical protein